MIRYFIFLLLVLPIENLAQDANELLREAQRQETLFHENEAFAKYTEVLRIQPSNLSALCKCSELCSRIGNRQPDKSKKADYFRAAKTYASAALRINPNNSEANFVMAFALGRQSLISSGKEKMTAVKDIRQYAENAIRLDPSNFKAYHVLGRWHYEVSDLSIAERSLAKWIFGGLPKASIQDAIQDFDKSRSLNPAFLLNYFELARSYHRIGEKQKSIEMLNKTIALPNAILDDTKVKEQARGLLKDWK